MGRGGCPAGAGGSAVRSRAREGARGGGGRPGRPGSHHARRCSCDSGGGRVHSCFLRSVQLFPPRLPLLCGASAFCRPVPLVATALPPSLRAAAVSACLWLAHQTSCRSPLSGATSTRGSPLPLQSLAWAGSWSLQRQSQAPMRIAPPRRPAVRSSSFLSPSLVPAP